MCCSAVWGGGLAGELTLKLKSAPATSPCGLPPMRCCMTGNRRVGGIVQERDLALFRELGVMRVVDSKQAQIVSRLSSMRRTNRRLLPLVRTGLLRKIY